MDRGDGRMAQVQVVQRCPRCGVEHDHPVRECEACGGEVRYWCRAHSREFGWLESAWCARCEAEDARREGRAPRPAPAPPPTVVPSTSVESAGSTASAASIDSTASAASIDSTASAASAGSTASVASIDSVDSVDPAASAASTATVEAPASGPGGDALAQERMRAVLRERLAAAAAKPPAAAPPTVRVVPPTVPEPPAPPPAAAPARAEPSPGPRRGLGVRLYEALLTVLSTAIACTLAGVAWGGVQAVRAGADVPLQAAVGGVWGAAAGVGLGAVRAAVSFARSSNPRGR